jgi:hypothetical protein
MSLKIKQFSEEGRQKKEGKEADGGGAEKKSP